MNINQVSIKKYLLLMIVFVIISFGSVIGIGKFLNHDIALSVVPWRWILILGSMTIIYMLLDGLRFYIILKTFGLHLSYPFVVRQAVIGVFVSNVTPFLAGGSIAQIYFLKEQGVPISEAAAATSIRAILASVFFFVSMPLVIYFNPEIMKSLNIDNIKWLPWVSLGFICWTVFIVIVGKYRINSMRIISKIIGVTPISVTNKKKLIEELDDFLLHLDLFLRGDKKHLLISFLATSVHFIFVFLFSVVILKLYGYNLSPILVVSGQMLSNFIMYFGFTPGASGFAEGGFAYFFSQFVSADDLMNIVFLWRASTVYFATFIGMILFVIETIKTRKKHHVVR